MKRLETSLWIIGTLLIAVYFIGQTWAESLSADAVAAFTAQKRSLESPAENRSATTTAVATLVPAAPVAVRLELALPAPRSIATAVATAPSTTTPATRATITTAPNDATPSDYAAIAVLRIPRIALEVAVAAGTDASTLRRGAGLIAGSAWPGSAGGNISIAAHRDSFFRPLADLVVGDVIELESLRRTRSYRIEALSVVNPGDVHVLAPTGKATLTLVTCFPFRFVGHAPQRFIVRAVAAEFDPQTPRRKT